MLHSFPLLDGRQLTIYLPPGYEDGNQRYPVLYLNDGQNLFDPARAFGGEPWRVDETATSLIEAGAIEPLIIAGIDNSGANRINEYTHTHDRKRGGGEADAYAAFVIGAVKPFVDATVRTKSDPPNTAIGGSSLGGLVSLYIALRHAEIFGKAAIMSPSVWWDRRSILRVVRKAPKTRPRLWVDMGTAESKGPGTARRVLEDARLLKAGLLGAGWIEGVDLRYEDIEGGEHNERAWGDRFGRVVQWLFPS
jgi:predicted alpha/beta superfamily hydrolase